MKSYEDVIEELYQKFPPFQKYGQSAFKPGLERVRIMSERLGCPEQQFPSIHIAGTNGKGSTAHILAAVYQEKGLQVGVYSSPHLLDFRERIKINGDYIPKETVVEYYRYINEILGDLSPSFFEITTIMAFQYFAEQKVDLAIIETGLGGRLDATNIVQPLASVITPISMEHEAYLGDTLEKIASEKAGIIKSKTPVIISQQNRSIANVFDHIAQEKNAPLTYSSDEKHWETDLMAKYQQNNIQLAYKVVQTLQNHWSISDDLFSSAVKSVRSSTHFLGRFMQLQEQPAIIADAGHNTAGLIATWESFCNQLPKEQKTLIIACSSDKNISAFFKTLPNETTIILTEYDQPRTMKTEDLALQVDAKKQNIHVIESAKKAVEFAKRITNQEDAILITGSVFLIAEIFPLFFKK